MSLKIMSLGDSISAGDAASHYRTHLGYLLRERGTAYEFVGHYNDVLLSEASRHSAYWGITAQQVDESWVNLWTSESRPDVVLVHLGTNDISIGSSPTKIEGHLRSIASKIWAIVPGAKVVISKIIGRSDLETFNKQTEALNQLIAKLPTEEGFIVCDVNAAVNRFQGLYDGVHPFDYSYSNMALAFVDTLVEAGVVSDQISNLRNVLRPGLRIEMSEAAGKVVKDRSPTQVYENRLGTFSDIYERPFFAGQENYFTVSLGQPHEIYAAEIIHYSAYPQSIDNSNTRDYSLSASIDGGVWQEAISVMGNEHGRTMHEFPPIVCDKIKFSVSKANALNGGFVRIRELRVLGRPA